MNSHSSFSTWVSSHQTWKFSADCIRVILVGCLCFILMDPRINQPPQVITEVTTLFLWLHYSAVMVLASSYTRPLLSYGHWKQGANFHSVSPTIICCLQMAAIAEDSVVIEWSSCLHNIYPFQNPISWTSEPIHFFSEPEKFWYFNHCL